MITSPVRRLFKGLVLVIGTSLFVLAVVFFGLWVQSSKPLPLAVTGVRLVRSDELERQPGDAGDCLAVRIHVSDGLERWDDPNRISGSLKIGTLERFGVLCTANGVPVASVSRQLLAGQKSFEFRVALDDRSSDGESVRRAIKRMGNDGVNEIAVELTVVDWPFDSAKSDWVSLEPWRGDIVRLLVH